MTEFAAAFTLHRGVARIIRLTMTAPGSVAGWTTRLSLRRRLTAPDPLTLDKAGLIVDAGTPTTPGVFTVPLTAAETLALDAGTYDFSFERVDVGNEDLLTIGTATVEYDVRNAL